MENTILVRSHKRLIVESGKEFSAKAKIVFVEPAAINLYIDGRRKKLSADAFYDLRHGLIWTACPLYNRCLGYLIKLSFGFQAVWKSRFLCFICPFLQEYKSFAKRADYEEAIAEIKRKLPESKGENAEDARLEIINEKLDYILILSSDGYRIYERRNGGEKEGGYYELPDVFSSEEVYASPLDYAETFYRLNLPIGHAMQDFYKADYFTQYFQDSLLGRIPAEPYKKMEKQARPRIIYGRQTQVQTAPAKDNPELKIGGNSRAISNTSGRFVVKIDGSKKPISAISKEEAMKKVRRWQELTINTEIRLFEVKRGGTKEIKL